MTRINLYKKCLASIYTLIKYLVAILLLTNNSSVFAYLTPEIQGRASWLSSDIQALYETPYDKKNNIKAIAKYVNGKFYVEGEVVCSDLGSCSSMFQTESTRVCSSPDLPYYDSLWLPYYEVINVSGVNWYGILTDVEKRSSNKKTNGTSPYWWVSETDLKSTTDSIQEMLEYDSPELVIENVHSVDFYDSPNSVPSKILREDEFLCGDYEMPEINIFELLKFTTFNSEEYVKVRFNSAVCRQGKPPFEVIKYIKGDKFLKLYNQTGHLNLWWNKYDGCGNH